MLWKGHVASMYVTLHICMQLMCMFARLCVAFMFFQVGRQMWLPRDSSLILCLHQRVITCAYMCSRVLISTKICVAYRLICMYIHTYVCLYVYVLCNACMCVYACMYVSYVYAYSHQFHTPVHSSYACMYVCMHTLTHVYSKQNHTIQSRKACGTQYKFAKYMATSDCKHYCYFSRVLCLEPFVVDMLAMTLSSVDTYDCMRIHVCIVYMYMHNQACICLYMSSSIHVIVHTCNCSYM